MTMQNNTATTEVVEEKEATGKEVQAPEVTENKVEEKVSGEEGEKAAAAQQDVSPPASSVVGTEDEDEELPEAAKTPAKSPLNLDEKDILEELLINPKGVIDRITEKVVENVDKRSQDIKHRQAAWEGFYKANPELEQFKDDLVPLMTKRLMSGWKSEITQGKRKAEPSWDEGSKLLAEETRRIVKKIRESDPAEEVVGSNAVAFSSSGSPAPHVVKEMGKAKNFAEQVRAIKQRRLPLR